MRDVARKLAIGGSFTRRMVRVAFTTDDRVLREGILKALRDVTGSAEEPRATPEDPESPKLPEEPHRVLQDALDEGRLAEETTPRVLTIFDAPGALGAPES